MLLTIDEAKKVHGDIYDYSKSIIIGNRTQIIIICKKHGEFKQTPYHHITRRQNCSKCMKCKLKTTEEFIEQAKKIHGDIYNYSEVKYENAKIEIIIICPYHGKFKQTPDSHLNKQGGCSKCSKKYCPTTEEFIEQAKEIHCDIYDYSEVKYKNTHTKIIIICPINNQGRFKQEPNSHLSGNGCRKCTNKGESKLNDFLETLYIKSKIYWNIRKNPILICRNIIPQEKKDGTFIITNAILPYDFICVLNNGIVAIVELDGKQHFEQVHNRDPPEKIHKTDIFKMKYALNHDIAFIRITWDCVYNDRIDWRTILKDTLSSIKPIEIKYISENNEYKDFEQWGINNITIED